MSADFHVRTSTQIRLLRARSHAAAVHGHRGHPTRQTSPLPRMGGGTATMCMLLHGTLDNPGCAVHQIICLF